MGKKTAVFLLVGLTLATFDLAGVRALAVIAGSLEDSNQTRIAELATKNRLPAIYPGRVLSIAAA